VAARSCGLLRRNRPRIAGESVETGYRGGIPMHAVLVSVTINDREASEKQLREDVIPQVQQAPGCVAGLLAVLS
jgi:hypothetical protein